MKRVFKVNHMVVSVILFDCYATRHNPKKEKNSPNPKIRGVFLIVLASI